MHSLKTILTGAGLAAALAFAGAAQAADLYTFAGSTGDQPTDFYSYSADFNAGAGPGVLTFTLNGYASLDGDNWYEDDFSIYHNSNEILRATFNLGGGGNDIIFFSPNGSVITKMSNNPSWPDWAGGTVAFNVPLALVQGQNNLTFAYHALSDGHAGFQGTGDEGWGLTDIKVTGGAAVPEPMAWALMITGFGLAGVALRRRFRAVA